MLVRSSLIIDLFSMVVLRVDSLKAYMGALPSIDYSCYLIPSPSHKVDSLLLLIAVCEADLCTLDLSTDGQWLIHKLQRTSSLWKTSIETPCGSGVTHLSLLSATKIVLILPRHMGYSAAPV